MPYAQLHYPFENKEKFERNFPADFIAEGLDQVDGLLDEDLLNVFVFWLFYDRKGRLLCCIG